MDTNETIQADVSGNAAEVEDQQQPDPSPEETSQPLAQDPGSKRERKMAEIAELRREEIEVERKGAAEIDGPFSEQVSSPEEAPVEQEDNIPLDEEEVPPVAAEVEQPASPNGWSVAEDGTRTKTLMVNGEPRQISEEQYDRMLQKDLAGDQKLRMASELETQLAERARYLEEKERQLTQAPAQPPVEGAGEELKQVISEYQDALLDGDTDVAAEKMAQIVGMGRGSSTPNIDVIVSQATTQIREQDRQERYQSSVNKGWEAFQADYQDVLADPDAMAFADIQIIKLRKSDPDKSPEEILLTAGQITRDRLRLSGGDEAPADSGDNAEVVDLRAERVARKAHLKPIPKTGGSKNKRQEAPKIDMSPEAKIARMRQSRFK